MTEGPASPSVSAGHAFDAALMRGRAARAEELPNLPKVTAANTSVQAVAELRGVLSARFAHGLPAAAAADLHREALRALSRLKRRLYWRRVRLAVADVLMTYGLPILGVLVVTALIGLAIVFRESILGFIWGLLAGSLSPPTPVPPLGPSGVSVLAGVVQ
jgi:hypothetical protein